MHALHIDDSSERGETRPRGRARSCPASGVSAGHSAGSIASLVSPLSLRLTGRNESSCCDAGARERVPALWWWRGVTAGHLQRCRRYGAGNKVFVEGGRDRRTNINTVGRKTEEEIVSVASDMEVCSGAIFVHKTK